MVIGYHLIWTLYGWWLPNDPRGSMSRSIESDVIAELGNLHYGRKKVQPSSKEIRAFYKTAESKLKHELFTLSSSHTTIVAQAFADVIRRASYTCYACAIMPDHIHLLIRKHKHRAEEMIEHFQALSCERLITGNPAFHKHPIWGGPGWKVFLDTPDDVRRTIPYIQNNPLKLRLPPQTWPFIKPYDNWPLHKRVTRSSSTPARAGA